MTYMRYLHSVCALGLAMLLVSGSQADIIEISISGEMDGGGPGWRYDKFNSVNLKNYVAAAPFTLTFRYNTLDPTTITSGTFSIGTSIDSSSDGDTTGTLNVTGIELGALQFTNADPGEMDIMRLAWGTAIDNGQASGGGFKEDDGDTGTFGFDGVSVFDDGGSSVSATGSATKQVAVTISGTDLWDSAAPTAIGGTLDNLSNNFRIKFRESSKVSLKGSTGASPTVTFTAVPEPGALPVLVAMVGYQFRRRRQR